MGYYSDHCKNCQKEFWYNHNDEYLRCEECNRRYLLKVCDYCKYYLINEKLLLFHMHENCRRYPCTLEDACGYQISEEDLLDNLQLETNTYWYGNNEEDSCLESESDCESVGTTKFFINEDIKWDVGNRIQKAPDFNYSGYKVSCDVWIKYFSKYYNRNCVYDLIWIDLWSSGLVTMKKVLKHLGITKQQILDSGCILFISRCYYNCPDDFIDFIEEFSLKEDIRFSNQCWTELFNFTNNFSKEKTERLFYYFKPNYDLIKDMYFVKENNLLNIQQKVEKDCLIIIKRNIQNWLYKPPIGIVPRLLKKKFS